MPRSGFLKRMAAAGAALAFALAFPLPAHAYVEAPMSLGDIIRQSTNIVQMQVVKVDREKNLIIYQKLQDIKGKHPADQIKHNIGRGGLRPGEWEEIMKWAEVGKLATFFHNGGASETFFGTSWYQSYPQGDWWGMSHGEPFLLRSYAGKVEKFPAILADILDNKEVVVPCMVDGDKEAIHKKTARIQRLKASLKLLDYNPKRDFVGWGGEEIRRLAGMGGFDRLAGLPRLDAEAQSVTTVDFDNDGKLDICLCGANKVVLLQNGGDGFIETALPGFSGGARAAVWADHNGDGLPDLLLATPTGPRLFTNLGKGQFRDDTNRLPREAAYNLTAAAWGDFDGDGKPDLLLANGFHGLRLYKNTRPDKPRIVPPKLGDWYAIGMFRAANPAENFKTEFPIEKEKFDEKKTYKGKRNTDTNWKKTPFKDGEVESLTIYGQNCANYIYREIEASAATEFPVTVGADDTITVWLNGERIFADDGRKPVDQPRGDLVLKLKPGTNALLIKICNVEGECGFLFRAGNSADPPGPWFADVSAAWGLAPTGLGADVKGDTLAVADFNGDGKPDFLYGAGSGLFALNVGGRFVPKPDSGINYRPGKIGPSLGDFDGDGLLDLFVPQSDGKCKLFRNTGDGRFTDVTAASGDLAKPIPGAVSAAWGDFDNDGLLDLVVCRLRGANRYYKNMGNGVFADRSAEIGLTQKVFNSQAAAFADLNGDGQLDLVLNNEGQESIVLFGVAAPANGRTSLAVSLNGTPAFNGGKVVIRDSAGRGIATCWVTGSDCRGGQCGLAPRFVLTPGAYKIEFVGSDGKIVTKDVTVDSAPMSIRIQ
jgi:VCBS repeat protein/FG-GAP repeat protein